MGDPAAPAHDPGDTGAPSSDWTRSRDAPVSVRPAVDGGFALAVYGFHTSLGGKPMFGRSLLED